VEQHYVRRNEVNDWSREALVVSRICREVPWYLVRAYFTRCPTPGSERREEQGGGWLLRLCVLLRLM